MKAFFLSLIVVTLAFGQWDNSNGSGGAVNDFYNLRSSYVGAQPFFENNLDAHIPAIGKRIFCIRSKPADGLAAGVFQGLYINFAPPGNGWNNITSNSPTAYRWLTNTEFMLLNYYNGVADTITRYVTGDTTDVGDYIPRSAMDGVFGYPAGSNTQWNNPWSSLNSVYAGTGSTTGVRATMVRVGIEFMDSVEVWMRPFSGSKFNRYGTYDDMSGAIDSSFATKALIAAGYMGVEYSLVPSTANLYGRRARIQYTNNRGRNYDFVGCGFTPSNKTGFVRYWGCGIGSAFTIGTPSGAPWTSGGDGYSPDFTIFPDNNIPGSDTDAMLEFNFSMWKGAGLKGQPCYATLRDAASNGATTINVLKSDATKSWSDYVPVRGDVFKSTNWNYTTDLYKVLIRNSSAASTGGTYLAFRTLTDNGTYWTLSDIYTGEPLEFATSVQGNYDAGDQVLLLNNYLTEGTGSEDWPSPSGFYTAYTQLVNYDWTGYPSIKNFNFTADSVLWDNTLHQRQDVDGVTPGLQVGRTRGQSQYRLWGPDLTYPQELRFSNERVMFGFNKNKPQHGSANMSLYTWPMETAFVYYTDDLFSGNGTAPATPSSETYYVYADTGAFVHAMTYNIAKDGTYTWITNQVTVTSNGHGISNGSRVYVTFKTGTGSPTNGYYTLTSSATNTFTFNLTGSGGGGLCLITPTTTLTSTYSLASNVNTVTSTTPANNHIFSVGSIVYADFTSGTATDGTYTVTGLSGPNSTGLTSFTFADVEANTSGNATIYGAPSWAMMIRDTLTASMYSFTVGVPSVPGDSMACYPFDVDSTDSIIQKIAMQFDIRNWEDSIDATHYKVIDSCVADVVFSGWDGPNMATNFADDSTWMSFVKFTMPYYGLDNQSGTPGRQSFTGFDDKGKIFWDTTTKYQTFKGSMYEDNFRTHFKVSLPASFITEGYPAGLGLMFRDFDMRSYPPQTVGVNGTYLLLSNVLASDRTRLTIYYHTVNATAPKDTLYISFSNLDYDNDGTVEASEKFLKDAALQYDSKTTTLGTNANMYAGQTTGGTASRIFTPIISLTQLGRDSIQNLTIHSAVCSLMIDAAIAGVDTFFVFNIGDASANSIWDEATVCYQYRTGTTLWGDSSWSSGGIAGGQTIGLPLDTCKITANIPGGTTNAVQVFRITQAIADMANPANATTRDGIALKMRGTSYPQQYHRFLTTDVSTVTWLYMMPGGYLRPSIFIKATRN